MLQNFLYFYFVVVLDAQWKAINVLMGIAALQAYFQSKINYNSGTSTFIISHQLTTFYYYCY